MGEPIDIRLNQGVSLPETDENDFDQSRSPDITCCSSHPLACAIDAPVVLTGSARVRYKRPVRLGERVVAKAAVKVQRGNVYLISVYSYVEQEIVFKGQFIVTVPK